MTRVPKIHSVIRHRVHDIRKGGPQRFNLRAQVEELEQIVSAGKDNPSFNQPRLEVFLQTLLAEKTCCIGYDILSAPKNLRSHFKIILLSSPTHESGASYITLPFSTIS